MLQNDEEIALLRRVSAAVTADCFWDAVRPSCAGGDGDRRARRAATMVRKWEALRR